MAKCYIYSEKKVFLSVTYAFMNCRIHQRVLLVVHFILAFQRKFYYYFIRFSIYKQGKLRTLKSILISPVQTATSGIPVSRETCPPPKKNLAPGSYFLGNLARSSEIWPPRKHSLLHRFKLGNREAFSKMKILKVFVSVYG